MTSSLRGPSFSYDASTRRSARREHWIPLVPGEDDLRSRAQPLVGSAAQDDEKAREFEEIAG